jgi:hypothetical protein
MVVVGGRLSGSTDAPSVEELERLWRAPAYDPPPPAPRTPTTLAAWLPRALPVAWLATMVVLIGFEPVPAEEVTPPLWADVVATVFFLSLATAAFAGITRHRGTALVASLGAAGVGLVLAWACGATEHHLGSWWIAEIAIFGALFAASAAALALRRQR